MDEISLYILGGILIGLAFWFGTRYDKLTSTKISGFIIVDENDPDGAYLFLELNEPIDQFSTRKTARFGVIINDSRG